MGCGSGHFGHFGHFFSRLGHSGHRGSYYDRGAECHPYEKETAPSRPSPKDDNEDMLRTIKMRFVNGEISEDEYMRLKKIILD